MEERCANDDLEQFGPADDVETSQQTDTEVDVCIRRCNLYRLNLVVDQRYIFKRKTKFSLITNLRLPLIFAGPILSFLPF